MYSMEQKIMWLCVAILILSAISAKILYTQFGKDSLFKMPTSYYASCPRSSPCKCKGKCMSARDSVKAGCKGCYN